MLKKALTEQELIKKVDDYNIFNYYFGNFDLNKCYPSVFRRDSHPSTGFFINNENRVVYNDLSSGEKLGAIDFVAKMYALNYYQALEKIAKDFGVIEGKDNTPRAAIKKFRNKVKTEKHYEVTKGIWRERELDYWKEYSITKEELEANFIYPCRELRLNGVVIENPMDYLRFVYVINHLDKNQYVKIYSPYDPIYKWVGNVPKSAIFGLVELPFASDTLMITKGNKDKVIWKKYMTDVIAPQSESQNSMPEDVCEMININYKKVYINFDADPPGQKGAKWYQEKYGWEPISVPEKYYKEEGIKDFADLVKIKGLGLFEKYIKWKKLI